MKLAAATDDNIIRIGDVEDNKVSIDTRNVDFITTLLTSNLYSHPFESFLRETVANAWDSQIEAGNTKHPVLILIQNDNYNYRVSVRDYGTGLSPERFSNIYRNIGSSTKRDSNDYIGCLGIGRFSCLSVSPQARITSYYNSRKYSYLMYKNGTGINIDLLQEDDTDQPNGLEVSISSILNNSTLQSALTQIQCFPNVVIKTDGLNQYQQDSFYCIKTFNERKIISFNNFSIIKRGYNQCYAKMGNMIYPYDWSSVGNDHQFKTEGIILNVPMGSVDITPNRESLQLTQRTKDTLNTVLNKARTELENLCRTYVNKDFKSLGEYIHAITQGYLLLMVNSKSIEVSLEDIPNVNFNNCSIESKKIPVGFEEYVKKVINNHIDKENVYKYINCTKREWYLNVESILYGKYKIVIKEDRLKSKTLQYFQENTDDKYLIYSEENWELAKHLVFKKTDNKECFEYIEQFIPLHYLKNSDVPADYKVEKKEKVTTIRRYGYDGGYTPLDYKFFNWCPKTLYVIDKISRDDYNQTISQLAKSFIYCCKDNLQFLTIKSSEFDVFPFGKRKNCITLEDFLVTKNNLIKTAIEYYLINQQQQNASLKYNIDLASLPIRKEFVNSKYFKFHDLIFTESFNDLIQLYKDNNWLNTSIIEYYSITEQDASDYKVYKSKQASADLLIKLATIKKLKHTNQKVIRL